ncbi:HEPN domain-containing protein [Thermococcus sp. MAR1]|uniref:HEPN domain-containing protein n=1 Tax=Thermococcus sp. MAR1 TaxID=1638263 RepID=UPI001438AA7D|nr:HEPN domain-containing protein [Thermococcus sp. MAR1]NJE09765.1 HEPN domain-containing protein [Thermococcus sp. MAR1]
MKQYKEILKKAQESLEAAKILLKRGFYGFALSRAYYTMFYCSEALLLTKGISVSKHSALIALFGREFIKTGEVPHKFFTHLRTAFNLRQTADYSFVVDITEEEARENIRRAEEFLAFTKEYLSSKGFLEE